MLEGVMLRVGARLGLWPGPLGGPGLHAWYPGAIWRGGCAWPYRCVVERFLFAVLVSFSFLRFPSFEQCVRVLFTYASRHLWLVCLKGSGSYTCFIVMPTGFLWALNITKKGQ